MTCKPIGEATHILFVVCMHDSWRTWLKGCLWEQFKTSSHLPLFPLDPIPFPMKFQMLMLTGWMVTLHSKHQMLMDQMANWFPMGQALPVITVQGTPNKASQKQPPEMGTTWEKVILAMTMNRLKTIPVFISHLPRCLEVPKTLSEFASGMLVYTFAPISFLNLAQPLRPT